MRVAALYDIHGNLPALESVLADVQRANVDRLIVGGDVLPGPMPRECLDLVKSLKIQTDFIIGNGDRETVAARRGQVSAIIPEYFRAGLNWNAQQLTDADERDIASWPLTRRLQIPGIGEALFCHATPRNDTEIFTSATLDSKLRPIFDPLNADLIVCGHTHMQFDRLVGRTRVVNAGSVGMPFQDPGAYWLLIDSTPQLRRTNYDLQSAATRVRRTDYPHANEFAARNILESPATAAMIEAFSKAELN